MNYLQPLCAKVDRAAVPLEEEKSLPYAIDSWMTIHFLFYVLSLFFIKRDLTSLMLLFLLFLIISQIWKYLEYLILLRSQIISFDLSSGLLTWFPRFQSLEHAWNISSHPYLDLFDHDGPLSFKLWLTMVCFLLIYSLHSANYPECSCIHPTDYLSPLIIARHLDIPLP